MNRGIAAALAMAVMAAGCSHCPVCGGEWGAARLAAAMREKKVEPRIVEVSGSVSCPERIAVLPTYRLRVRLARSGDQKAVAESMFAPIGSFPAFFLLQYDAAAYGADETLRLSAELLSGDTAILSTDVGAGIRAGEVARGIDLVLVRRAPASARQ